MSYPTRFVRGGSARLPALRPTPIVALNPADEARAAYDAAIGLSDNTAEQAWLTHRRGQLR